MTFQDFLDLLGVKEDYQIQSKLMDVMLSDNKNEFLDSLIDKGFDVSKDEIRDIFEAECANRKTLKQDYTPDCLCDLASKLCGKQKEILDVCCGVGSLSIKNIMSGDTHFLMEEVSDLSISLLLLNMSIRNCGALIYQKDVLTKEVFKAYKLTKSDKYSDIEIINNHQTCDKCDCVISNPPYSLQWQPLNDERFMGYELAPKSKADYVFVLDCLYRLNENGSAYIILPHGVLFRGGAEEKIRQALLEDNVIDCVIGLPEKLFSNTSIPVIILCLKKNRNNKDVLFIDASKCFDKIGKQNILNSDHISKIVNTYKERNDIEKYSRNVSYDEIKVNDFNLNIPRYIDTFEEKEPVDIAKSIAEMIEIENEIHTVGLELAKMMEDLNGDVEYEQNKQALINYLTNKYIHDTSIMVKNIYEFIENDNRLKNHDEVNLLDIATIERSKKGKQYKKGCSLIQLSATKGEMAYLENDSEVESKYGVIIPKNNINPKYLYFMLTINMPDFLQKYQTGLNIVPDVFKFMKLEIHSDIEIQNQIASMFTELEAVENNYLSSIDSWKNIKQYHLDNMFI